MIHNGKRLYLYALICLIDYNHEGHAPSTYFSTKIVEVTHFLDLDTVITKIFLDTNPLLKKKINTLKAPAICLYFFAFFVSITH